jgi:hypothetical protein
LIFRGRLIGKLLTKAKGLKSFGYGGVVGEGGMFRRRETALCWGLLSLGRILGMD